jgi:mannose-6-phosphate isomerase-like protein (cupin superfamily)
MSRAVEVVNLGEKLEAIAECWSPSVVGAVNDCQAKLVKMRGEFAWHRHEAEDEMFLVLHGTLTMRLRDGDRTVRAGEFIVIPRGVEHCPATDEEVHVLLFEPATTRRRGDAD